jgi:predicted dehydrogenase
MMETVVKTDKLKIGFLGVGWIGKHRMQALSRTNVAMVSSICDYNKEAAKTTCSEFEGSVVVDSFEDMLDTAPDGIVISTPSALHAQQSIAALERGISVFCQKPLGRNFQETLKVVETAKKFNKLLGVDFCYRYTTFQKVYNLIQSGALGDIYAADLTFHNAYGPDKAWFYDPKLSGGGCVIDLGVHLVDLALWSLNFPEISSVNSSLFHKGILIKGMPEVTEDYATAQIETATGTSIRLTCSWNLPAGKDAIIDTTFYGTKGGASFKNVKGSFYDFTVEQYNGTNTSVLSLPPDDWGGRAIAHWAEDLYKSDAYNENANEFAAVANILDKIYKRS